MPRRKVGFLGLELGDGVEGEEEEEERMKTPTPTRTWGGWGGIFWGCFFSCCARDLVVCLFWEMVVVVIFQLYLGVTGNVANVGLIVVASGSVAE